MTQPFQSTGDISEPFLLPTGQFSLLGKHPLSAHPPRQWLPPPSLYLHPIQLVSMSQCTHSPYCVQHSTGTGISGLQLILGSPCDASPHFIVTQTTAILATEDGDSSLYCFIHLFSKDRMVRTWKAHCCGDTDRNAN